jgi:hypothetical protein
VSRSDDGSPRPRQEPRRDLRAQRLWGPCWAVAVGVAVLAVAAGCGGGTSAGSAQATITVVRTVTVTGQEPAATTAAPSASRRSRSCGPSGVSGAKGSLRVRGLTCATARQVLDIYLRTGQAQGFTCAASLIICWKDGTSYGTAASGFKLLSETSSGACPAGQAPAGTHGACGPSAQTAACTYTAGFQLPLTLRTVTCGTAEQILSMYFQLIEQRGQTSEINITGEVTLVDYQTDLVEHWVCQGTMYPTPRGVVQQAWLRLGRSVAGASGSCYNHTAAEQHQQVPPMFSWASTG